MHSLYVILILKANYLEFYKYSNQNYLITLIVSVPGNCYRKSRLGINKELHSLLGIWLQDHLQFIYIFIVELKSHY